MDLSKLTRPAILCQCSRCSSSLAALENEWAKLSNSYSVAAGWLSIELHRISISSEKKQIPQSSELSLIRGRIIQEIACKLCQQKLGVISEFEDGPFIFWKISKVSFREIVTMRTVDPTFKEEDGALENLLFPKPKDITFRFDGAAAQSGALVPTESNEIDHYNTSVEHQMQQQGQSLNHISSSVSHLNDTMHELKNAFTSMRIELHGPNRYPTEHDLSHPDFNMITTVLKELKAKADEIEKLKLEIEALKFRNRYAEEQTARQAPQLLNVEAPLPEVGTPGLLQGSRKRPYPFPEQYHSNHDRPVADSFDDDDDDEDSMVDFFLADTSMPSVKIPLKDHETTAEPSAKSPRLQIEVNHPPNPTQPAYSTPQSLPSDEPVAKRPRLGNSSSGRKGRGRPSLKSISQATQPDAPPPLKPTPLNEQNGNVREQPSSTPNNHQQPPETRPHRSRSLRSRSRPPPLNSRNRMSVESPEDSAEKTSHDKPPESTTQPVVDLSKENTQAESDFWADENRKARNAARDLLAKMAMQREEAMDTEAAR
ncbi:hypothetical protein BJY04DRAFT_180418 [Aspergillus karnatakaensis]|uniref:uncharacterized protein n=1 Tax=Aspergillus karnatakaensis TaxID=1810916 RepID=UPI003CCD4494